jgi:phosphonate degradation associated HDIG domain protein
MLISVDEIARLLRVRGDQQYGREAVSQLAHALQCAYLAEQAGETRPTIVAALLHDLGHLVAAEHAQRGGQDPRGDDLHQHLAIPLLRGLLPASVLQPIRLHVDAKRYLCCTEAGYWETLSPVSKRSLEFQGGAFSSDQAEAFLAQPFSHEAVRLRRYDDQAKVVGQATPPLEQYLKMVAELALETTADN